MLLCDSVAALGTLVILVFCMKDTLQLWILCLINIVSGFMDAFQKPASSVAVTLLVDRESYAKASGMQASVNSVLGILTPVLASGLLGFGGLTAVLMVDLLTFLLGFITLLFLVKIPEVAESTEGVSFGVLCRETSVTAGEDG